MKRKSINEEFLSTPGELHALWFGFCNACKEIRTGELAPLLQEDIRQEYHYYLLGFYIARGFQILGAIAIALWIS